MVIELTKQYSIPTKYSFIYCKSQDIHFQRHTILTCLGGTLSRTSD